MVALAKKVRTSNETPLASPSSRSCPLLFSSVGPRPVPRLEADAFLESLAGGRQQDADDLQPVAALTAPRGNAQLVAFRQDGQLVRDRLPFVRQSILKEAQYVVDLVTRPCFKYAIQVVQSKASLSGGSSRLERLIHECELSRITCTVTALTLPAQSHLCRSTAASMRTGTMLLQCTPVGKPNAQLR
jgi:hypothetical protein